MSPREEATPFVSDLELESAILRGVASHRPVGRDRHILMLALQKEVHEHTGRWVPVTTLWEHLGALYDLEELDGMHSPTPSLPDSPAQLSPIPHPRRRRPRASRNNSSSSLSSLSRSPSPSRSAKVIDSAHFAYVFQLPGTRTKAPPPASPARGRNGTGESPTRRPSGSASADDESDSEGEWVHIIHARAPGEEEDDSWEAGKRAQLIANGVKGAKDAAPTSPEPEAEEEDDEPAPKTKKRRGRPPKPAASKGGSRRASNDARASVQTSGTPHSRESSPLTSDGEPPTPVAPKRRGRPPKGAPTPAKRARESVGDTDEDERPTGRRRRRQA